MNNEYKLCYACVGMAAWTLLYIVLLACNL